MGIERAITRWYVQRQVLLHEIAQMEAKLRPPDVDTQRSQSRESAALERQVAEAREKLRLMGSCPKPMMG